MKKNPDMKKIVKHGWTKFGFPHSYTSDALDTINALVSAEVKHDPRMKDTHDLTKSKQVNGKLINEKQFKSSMYTSRLVLLIESSIFGIFVAPKAYNGGKANVDFKLAKKEFNFTV